VLWDPRALECWDPGVHRSSASPTAERRPPMSREVGLPVPRSTGHQVLASRSAELQLSDTLTVDFRESGGFSFSSPVRRTLDAGSSVQRNTALGSLESREMVLKCVLPPRRSLCGLPVHRGPGFLDAGPHRAPVSSGIACRFLPTAVRCVKFRAHHSMHAKCPLHTSKRSDARAVDPNRCIACVFLSTAIRCV
jgi:hypothetical protein